MSKDRVTRPATMSYIYPRQTTPLLFVGYAVAIRTRPTLLCYHYMSALSKNEPEGFQDIDEGGLPALAGYVSKLNRRGAYQKRYFVAKGRFLAYYKDQSSLKVLACIDLKKVNAVSSASALPPLLLHAIAQHA